MPAFLTGAANHDGLQHAMFADRRRKLVEFLLAEDAARLIWVFLNAVDRNQKRAPGAAASLFSDIGEIFETKIKRHQSSPHRAVVRSWREQRGFLGQPPEPSGA